MRGLTAAVLATALAAACAGTASTGITPGGASPSAAASTPASSSPSATAAASETPTAAPSASASHAMAGHSMTTETVEVVIEDFAFVPETIKVASGSTVRWSNRHGEPHSVRAEDGSITSKLIIGGDPFEWVAEAAPGTTVAYFCGVHPAMKGTVEIE